MGHTGGLTNPRPLHGRCHAAYYNTDGPPCLKRGRCQKNIFQNITENITATTTLAIPGPLVVPTKAEQLFLLFLL